MNNRYSPLLQFAIFEREPQKNALPNKIIMGPYKTLEDAEAARLKYGFANDNNYVAQLGPDYYSPIDVKI